MYLKCPPPEVAALVAAQKETPDEFEFSYHASCHEREWITNSLGEFYEHKWLDDVLRLIKGGKEANLPVYRRSPGDRAGPALCSCKDLPPAPASAT